jgi:TonB family protein
MMKALGKALCLIVGLVPVAASACGCDHRNQAAGWEDWSYPVHRHVVHEELGELSALSHHTCTNYPDSAWHLSGVRTTWVDIRVGGDGWVHASRISHSSGRRDLDSAALACVADWHFRRGYDWQAVKIVWHAPTGHWES